MAVGHADVVADPQCGQLVLILRPYVEHRLSVQPEFVQDLAHSLDPVGSLVCFKADRHVEADIGDSRNRAAS